MSSSELTLYVEAHGGVRARRGDGAEASGKFGLNRLHQRLIALFDNWLQQDKVRDRRELEVFGSLLYLALFGENIGSLFEESLRELSNGDRLRLQLSFAEEAATLAGMPWEYLYFPDTDAATGFFLATHAHLVLSRYLPLRSQRFSSLQPESGPLRLLIVLSQPANLRPVLGDLVIEAVEKLTRTQPLEVEVLKKPTIENLLNALESARPHVLHFIGHARFNQAISRGEIALLSPDERTASWYPDYTFVEALAQTGTMPRLVLLHACEGAAVDRARGFSGLAPHLVRGGIQAVVAMQYEVTNRAAILFSRALYAELARARPVDDATQIARWKLATQGPRGYDDRLFGTPVLYMRSRDGFIVPAVSSRPSPM